MADQLKGKNMMKVAVWLWLVGFILVVACTPGDANVTTQTPLPDDVPVVPTIEGAGTESIVVTPLPDETALPTTDIPVVNAVITAMLTQDKTALQNLVHLNEIACTTADGLGGPPKCATGTPAGTVVRVLPVLGAEGHHVQATELPQALPDGPWQLYAVYIVPDTVYRDEAFPVGQYGLVFLPQAGSQELPITLMVTDEGIVRIDYHFDNSYQGRLEGVEFILEPQAN